MILRLHLCSSHRYKESFLYTFLYIDDSYIWSELDHLLYIIHIKEDILHTKHVN